MSSASFGWLAEGDRRVHFHCYNPGCPQHNTLNLLASDAAARWGADTTLEDIRRRLRCRYCGHRGPRIYAEVSGGWKVKMGMGD